MRIKKSIVWKLIIIIILVTIVLCAHSILSSDGANYWDGKENVTVAIAGDVMLGRGVPDLMASSGSPFSDVPELSKANLTILNLECSITDSANAVKGDMPMKAPTSAVSYINVGHEATLAAQANNHGFDYGVSGMKDGITALEKNNIFHMGVGDNSDQAYAPFVYEIGGRKITVLNYMDSRNFQDYSQDELPIADANNPGYAAYNETLMKEQVQQAHQNGSDFVLVYYHFGHAGVTTPDSNQTDMAHKAIDAGADTVVGTHPHVAQGIEMYNGKPVFYSMSDFVFDYSADGRAQCYFITFDLSGGNCTATVYPVLISGFIPHHLDADSGKSFLSGLNPQCSEMTINPDGTGTIYFNLTNPKNITEGSSQ